MSSRGRRRNGGGSNRRGNDQSSHDNARDNQRGRRNGSRRGSSDSHATSETPSGAQRRGSTPNTFGASSMGAQSSTAGAMGDYRARLERIRAQRPKLRQEFQRQGLMNPDGQMELKDAVKLIGICNEMCPEFERVRRIVENDVKAPECTPETEHLPRSQRVPDESRMVKAYARSAAGVDVELVSELRSPSTCLSTVDYLFDRLDDDDFEYLQSWIWDRTRSVRKDLRTQSITSRPDIKTYLTCLERIARFHLISMHQMAKSKREDYDHQQDLEQLNQTIMSLKERYADNRRAGIPSEKEAEFWAIRLILAPQYVTNYLEHEVHRLPIDIRNNGQVQVALELYRLLNSVLITRDTDYIQCQADWKKLWEMIKSPRVSYIMACAAEVSFNRVRHSVLDSLWRAYRVGNARNVRVVDSWTTDKLKDALGLDTDQEAVKLCEDFGFEFGTDKDGKTFLDLTKKGYAHNVLARPLDVKPQYFSAKLVEIKRHDRAFSAIIHGMSVKEARADGYIMDLEAKEKKEDENSLFVPEESATNTSVTNQQPNGVPATPAAATAKTPINPFAAAFQPSTTPASSSNPFLKAASNLPKQGLPTTRPLTAGIQPGLFDASKNRIQFATPGIATRTAALGPSDTPSSSVNPFVNGTGTPPTAAGSIFTSAASAAQANPFSSTPSTAQPNNSFANFAPAKPQQSGATETPSSNPPFSFLSQNPGAAATPPSNSPFTFAPSKKTNDETPQQPPPSASPFTPTGPPQNAAGAHDDAAVAAQAAARQKADHEKQIAAQKEKEKQETEARQRVVDAQRARAAQEAEQRRIEEQKRQSEAEAAARQQQILADQERRAREERERLVREEQQRQAQKEAAHVAQQRERDLAFQALTNNIMFDSKQGLLVQFFSNAALVMAEDVMADEKRKRREQEVAELRRQKGLALARAAMVHWINIVQKRKRAEQARTRRRRLKEQRRLASVEQNTDDPDGSPNVPTVAAQPNGASNEVEPIALGNTRRARRTEERRGSQTMNKATQTTLPDQGYVHATTQATPVLEHTSNGTPVTGYTQAYHQSTAPIDRTETDWFELRAMGIDPSKHRKRSFSYNSTSSEEGKLQMEPKRPRLFPAINDQDNCQLAIRPEEAKLPRSGAADETHVTSGYMLPVHQHTSVNGEPNFPSQQPTNGAKASTSWPSPNRRSTSLITRARELLAKTHTPQQSLPSAQHDWGRSVPNLGLSTSISSGSVIGKSVGATTQNDRPAYWNRPSRFVPKDLYGRGPAAIQEYINQRMSKSASGSARSMSVDVPAQSSPMPTQQSYAPQPDYSQGSFFQNPFIAQGAAGDTGALDEFFPTDPALPGLADQYLSGDQVHGESAYGTHDGDGGYSQQYAQPQEYLNEDAAMAGTEEEEEEYDEEAGEELGDEDDDPVQHGQGYVHTQEEDEYDEYDEYSDEEEEDDDAAPPVRHQFSQPGTQPYGQHQQSATPPVKQQFAQAGTTEDDAIELSD